MFHPRAFTFEDWMEQVEVAAPDMPFKDAEEAFFEGCCRRVWEPWAVNTDGRFVYRYVPAWERQLGLRLS